MAHDAFLINISCKNSQAPLCNPSSWKYREMLPSLMGEKSTERFVSQVNYPRSQVVILPHERRKNPTESLIIQ